MKATKKVIGELEKCYSLAMLHYQGKDHFLCAAEKESGHNGKGRETGG